MSEEQRSVLVHISGRVQGVWFRGWTKKTADALGLSGWVCNLPDGSVQAQFIGPSDFIDQMIENCRRGSPISRVDEVTISEQEALAPDTGSEFEIHHEIPIP